MAGGGGGDTLWMTTAGTTNAADLAGVSGIEAVFLQNGGTFSLANGITSAAAILAVGSAAVDTIDASAVTGYGVVFTGNGGADVLRGGSQDDTFLIADSAFALIDGNAGTTDRISLTAASQSFDLHANVAKVSDVEVIDLRNASAATLNLLGTDIALVNAGTTSLYVVGDADDIVTAGNGYTLVASGVANAAAAAGHTFIHFRHSSGSDLFIDSDILSASVTSTSGSATVPENTAPGVTVFAAGIPTAPGVTVTYTLSGTDAALFSINSSSGDVSFISSPNFENPGDAGANNVYNITVTAAPDNARPNVTEAITITVTDVNDQVDLDLNFGNAGDDRNAGLFDNVTPAQLVFGVAATEIADAEDKLSSVSITITAPQGGSVNAGEALGISPDTLALVSSLLGFTVEVTGNGGQSLTISAPSGQFFTAQALETLLENVTYAINQTDFSFNASDRALSVTVTDFSTGATSDTALLTLDMRADVTATAGQNAFTGGNLSDLARGGAGDDVIAGGAGIDALVGGADNDTLTGGSGDDTIIGNDATVVRSGATFNVGGITGAAPNAGESDTAIYSGASTDYAVTRDPSGSYTVADQVAGRDGTDTLWGIETIDFAGGASLQLAAAIKVFDGSGSVLLADATPRFSPRNRRPRQARRISARRTIRRHGRVRQGVCRLRPYDLGCRVRPIDAERKDCSSHDAPDRTRTR